ncbi:MAG TPA: glycosyltransferase family 4 protein [Bryobacteraceae bacterium]|nr:glycosyltransferase family 4 protein [Bryobacteraceae bacterium]
MSRRLRLAFFSPFRPQKSGIADYSEELLPHLAERAEIDLITGPYRISNDALRQFRVRPVAEFLKDHAAYDTAIYQVGNNLHHHGYMAACMSAVPGILVLHDYCLQYLTLGLTLREGKFRALVETLRLAHGRRAAWIAAKLLLNLTDPDRLSFAWPFLSQSKAIIVHSDFARELVRKDVPETPVRVIPMGVPDGDAATPAAALRSRYQLSADDFVLASISTLSRSKRLDVVLRALRDLKREVPRLKYVVAGGGNLGDDARRLIRDLGLEETVVLTGWISNEDYRGLIALADVIVDLRYPSGAETSASLTRAIAIGKPLILSEQGSFLEMPEAFSWKIPVGQEQVSLAPAVRRLAQDCDLRSRMANASREYFVANLQLSQAAQSYAAFAAEVADLPLPASAATHWNRPARGVSKFLISSIYKISRVGYLFRQYGWKDTLRRIREEMGADARPETA